MVLMFLVGLPTVVAFLLELVVSLIPICLQLNCDGKESQVVAWLSDHNVSFPTKQRSLCHKAVKLLLPHTHTQPKHTGFLEHANPFLVELWAGFCVRFSNPVGSSRNHRLWIFGGVPDSSLLLRES